MKLTEIIKKYECRVLTESLDTEKEIDFAFCTDLMSDALFIMNSVEDERILDHSILITGLATQQSVRTAEMLDISVLLLVRGKMPSNKVIDLAKESNIVLLSTDYTMFNTSGMMYQDGIKGVKYNLKW
jgi:predicted transcriptional regulator